MVRAKFQVIAKDAVEGSAAVKVVLEPRYDDTTPEDQRYAKYTPAGRIEMQVDNPPASDQLVVGKTFYVDFTEVDPPPAVEQPAAEQPAATA
jgi:hypothetical protein